MYPADTMEIAAAPSGSEQISATVTTGDTPKNPDANGASKALSGVPPPVFNGDREKSENFLDRFTGYELANIEAKQFRIPFLKTALCLSYINGPKVDAWAKAKRAWLKADQKSGMPLTSDHFWDDFEADFRAAFTDTDAQITAAEKLHGLKMLGSDIDTYIAEFDHLMGEAGYRKDDWGAIIKFKEGLQPKLLHQIIVHITPAPTTIKGWKEAARKRQTVYKELKNAGLSQTGQAYQGPSDIQKKFARALGMRNYQTPAQRMPNQGGGYKGGHQRHQSSGQVVPMDVDAGFTTPTGTTQKFTPLSDTERAELRAANACFYCKKPGHISKWCRSKPQNQKKDGPPGTRIKATNADAPKETVVDRQALLDQLGGFQGMLAMIKEETPQKQEEFVDLLQDF